MGVSIAITQQAAPTVTGTQDFTVSGFGTVKAYLTYVTNAVTNGTAVDHAVFGMGAGDGTREWSCGVASEHNQGNADVHSRATNDESIMILDLSNAVDGEANFDAFITDGVRFNWANAPSVAVLVTVILFGGDDLLAYADNASSEVAQDADTSVTAPGFTPDVLFFGTPLSNFNDSNSNRASFTMGIATNESTIQKGCVSTDATNSAPTSEVASEANSAYVMIELDASSSSRVVALELKSFDGSGFTLTKRLSGTTLHFGYVALGFTDRTTAKLENYDSPTATGDFARSGIGFTPQYVHLLPSFCDSQDTVETTGAGGAGAYGVCHIDANAECCQSFADEDNQSTTDTQSLVDNIAVNYARDDGTVIFTATGPNGLGSFDTDTGYTLNFTATDGTARKWTGLAIGVPPAVSSDIGADYQLINGDLSAVQVYGGAV